MTEGVDRGQEAEAEREGHDHERRHVDRVGGLDRHEADREEHERPQELSDVLAGVHLTL